ncbi:MAG: XdhC family aldehyde oxidoreductase maturation factor [Syntrophales bacterium]
MKETDALHNPTQLTRQIVQCLGQGESVALATVIARSGSGPREAGATMLVRPDGRTLGTVGGGLLEGQAAALAREVLASRRPACRSVSLAETKLEAGGMICGGHMELLVDFLDAADASCGAVFAGVLERQEANRPCWLVRAVPAAGGPAKTGIGLLDEAGFAPGTLSAPLPGVDLLAGARRPAETVVIEAGGLRYAIQPAGLAATVFIFGAGHVGRELAPICGVIGYRTIVIDDRAEFATAERFPSAAGIVVADSYAACFRRLSFDASSAVVIVTHGHAHDREVLSLALRTKAGYVGMISSRRKRELILASLREEGVAEADLARVHSPIGLAIGAETPAEIAVSIAAELIAVRAGKLR